MEHDDCMQAAAQPFNSFTSACSLCGGSSESPVKVLEPPRDGENSTAPTPLSIQAQFAELLSSMMLETGVDRETPEFVELMKLLMQRPEAVAQILDNTDDAVKEAANRGPHRELLLRAFLARPEADRKRLVAAIHARVASDPVNRVYRVRCCSSRMQGMVDATTMQKEASEEGDWEWWDIVGKIGDTATGIMEKIGGGDSPAPGLPAVANTAEGQQPTTTTIAQGGDGPDEVTTTQAAAAPVMTTQAAAVPSTVAHFSEAQVSPFSGASHQLMSALELEVVDLINAKRRAGFTCGDLAKNETVHGDHRADERSPWRWTAASGGQPSSTMRIWPCASSTVTTPCMHAEGTCAMIRCVCSGFVEVCLELS